MATTPSAVERALDAAIALPARRIQESIARMRRERPDADTAELVEMAASRFRTEAALTSGAVGASAALPAVGTGTAAALTVAELQGLRVVSPTRRRALVLSALLGEDGSEAVRGSLGLSVLYWAAQSLAQMPLTTVKSINAQLTKRMAKRTAAKGGALAVGRLVPFGIGAAIGWTGGRALANQVIEGAKAALGPAPESGAEPALIEA